MTATIILGASALFGAPAQALPLPVEPTDPVVSELWVNPAARANDEVTDVNVEILDFEMPADKLSVNVGETFTAKLKVTNKTDTELTDITLSVQRQEASTDVASARVAATSDNYPYYGPNLTLDQTLEPGESLETEVEIPTDSLTISQAGTYPVSVILSGQLDGVAKYMDSQRFLLPVLSTEGTEDSTPTTVIYPLSAQTHVLGGETGTAPEDSPLLVSSDELAGELTAEGRLSALLDAYLQSSEEVRDTTCLAIDPQLLDVIDRMTQGYTVAENRVSTVRQSQRLRDLWTADNQPNTGVPGAGTADAAAFLEKLRTAAADHCTVALPWADADLDAVSQTNNQWLMREAIQRGSTTIEDILGVTPETNVVIPGSGYISPNAAEDLGWADASAADRTPEEAWEIQSGSAEILAHSDKSALDSPKPTPGDVAAPTPTSPVSVLVSDNTVWRTPSADRFHALATAITAVTYQGSLSATLATLGENPETVGYSNPDSRYDYSLDSAAARNLSGQASLRLAVANSDPETPVLVIPSATLDAQDGEMLLQTTADLLAKGEASVFSLQQYVTANSSQLSDLEAAITTDGLPDETSFGAPYADPASPTESEVLRASQQAAYIDDLTGIMFNDPGIVLTRYGFTAPLRQDLLRALSLIDRRSFAKHSAATAESDTVLNDNRDTLQQLRSSVALLPPGNVYTRTSDSSPLIIVAQNGLPLPTETQILYSGPDNAQINTPGVVRIPALGSITLQMTADLPDDSERTDLTLWLASPDGATISEPVEISVQPRPNVTGTMMVVAAGIALLGGLVLFRFFSKKKAARLKDAAPTAQPKVRAGRRRQASAHSRSGRADDGSGSPKPPGAR
ncbi:DUF6049 family protein [Corynebacterium callunae]|uniref:hypothetical protein n=1 Tax=Corynebacterium callunae TaxID=1721 RepID=UPI0039824DE6